MDVVNQDDLGNLEEKDKVLIIKVHVQDLVFIDDLGIKDIGSKIVG